MTRPTPTTFGTWLRRIGGRVRARLTGEPATVRLWRRRAEALRDRAVFNAGHTDSELAAVTEMQKREMYPHLRRALRGDERLALDFGCGTGRFSADLAKMIGGRVVAADPIQRLLDLAPRDPSVDYRLIKRGRIPVPDASVDLAWICLVLGGIPPEAFDATIRELDRVLKPGGLVFLVENTSKGPGSGFWRFQSIEAYQRVFPGLQLEHVGDYVDLGERMSMFVGRKPTTGSQSP